MSDDGGGRRATVVGRVLLAVGALAGAVVAAVGDLVLFMYDDSCPQWEDEGTMAAERSPYSMVMCSPSTSEPPVVWVVPLVAACGLLVALWLGRRRTASVGRWLGRFVTVLVVPVLLLGLLHLVLPQDCLSGRPGSPGCVRDRELR